MSSIEAVQIKLEGRDGFMLWPTQYGSPPKSIDAAELQFEAPTVFSEQRINYDTPLFTYAFDAATQRWILREEQS